MTVKAKILIWGEYLDVEFHRDGSFEIVNKDMEYEIAFAAMGGDETPAIYLYRLIEQDRLDWLVQEFSDIEGFGTQEAEIFMIDMLDHVVDIYEEITKDTYLSYVIEELRKMVAGRVYGRAASNILKPMIAKLTSLEKSQIRLHNNALSYAYLSVKSIIDVMTMGGSGTKTSISHKIRMMDVQQYTACVAAWDEVSWPPTPKNEKERVARFIGAGKKERQWQLRRLLHLLEAKQAGKVIPDIGATP